MTVSLWPPRKEVVVDQKWSKSPMTPGHEMIGRVAAVGEGVEAWKVGDRIGAGWHGGHDGE